MNANSIRECTDPFLLFPYTFDRLKELFLACSTISNELLEVKLQNQYFSTYFDEIGAETIVLEKKYIDRDFLEDFSNYYVKCFSDYDRKCNRLHFFDSKFDSSQLETIISGNKQTSKELLEKIQKAYLGFIVVKNLPRTFIGRTCLKTYDTQNNNRFFPVTRTYDANLFGISLQVKTLAFQEQDTVVSACATSALWSMFNATGKLFQHTIPSPYEITKLATANLPVKTRVFPNNGLTLEMMAKAIKEIGLEPLFIATNNMTITKAAINVFI